MRRPLIAGNWKMTQGHKDALRLAEAIRAGIDIPPGRECAIFPPFTSLQAVADRLKDTPFRVGAQNCWHEEDGAYTGEISANLIRQAGGTIVLLGHSERRHVIGETDALIARKLRAVRKHGLAAILCVGETLAERDAGTTFDVVVGQVRASLEGLTAPQWHDVTVAYEPVWAIGTGRNATPAQAQEVHSAIRAELLRLFGETMADSTRILYGGSVKPGNIDGLMSMPDIDGALVGGASLDESDFHRIVQFEAKHAS